MKLHALICFLLVLATVSNGGIMDSNLDSLTSGGGTQFDIVAAVTQKSINAIVNSFLASEPNKDVVTVVYQQNPESGGAKYLLLTLEEAVEILGFNPFKIPDGTDDSDEQVQKLLEEKIYMGHSAKYGIPDVPPENMMSPIRFDNSDLRVTYSLVMAEFQTFSVEYDRDNRKDYVVAVSQSDYLSENPTSAPFTWPYTVTLGMKTIRSAYSLDDLPLRTREIMAETGNHFYANNRANIPLNSGTVLSIPTIPGIPADSELNAIFPTFAASFIENVDPSGDGIDLGLAVVADRYPQLRTEEIPADIDLVISRTNDNNGSPTSEYSSYTLNYLMTTDDTLIASPMQMRWNWIEPSEVNTYQGALAVRRGSLTSFLDELISPSLDRICFDLSASATCGEKAHFYWVLGACKELPTFEIYETPDNGVVMKFEQSDSVSAPQDPMLNCSTSIVTSASSIVYLGGSKITISSSIWVTGFARVDGQESGQSDLVKEQITTEYSLFVDETGRLRVKLEPKKASNISYKKKNNYKSFKAVPMESSADDLIEYVQAAVGSLTEYQRGFAEALETRLGSVSDFVMPKDMVLHDVAFSNSLDVVSHIKYLDTSSTAAWKEEKVRDIRGKAGITKRIKEKFLRMKDLQPGKMGVVTKDGVKIVPFEKTKSPQERPKEEKMPPRMKCWGRSRGCGKRVKATEVGKGGGNCKQCRASQ